MRFMNEIPESIQVLGDSQRIIQIFVNLLSNARDACPNDTKVSLFVERANNSVQFCVADEGPGIPPEIQLTK